MAAPVFRTDVNIRAATSQTLLDRPSNQRGLLSSEYLDNAAESANKQIDNDIKAMLDGFEALIGLSRIKDKDKFRIAQESFELEARADVMVRAAQSLTLLSHSLKLSLLLTQEPEESTEEGLTALDVEAIELIKSTDREKQRCVRLLEDMFGLASAGEDLVTKVPAREEVKSAIVADSEAKEANAPDAEEAKEAIASDAKEEAEVPGAEEPKDEGDLEMTLVE